MDKILIDEIPQYCKESLVGIRDLQDLVSGKWKVRIISTLFYVGKLRFMVLLRHMDGIAPKVLSKELKDMEMNHLVKRIVCNTKPITVEYELTDLGKSFSQVLNTMAEWGIAYRKTVIKKI